MFERVITLLMIIQQKKYLVKGTLKKFQALSHLLSFICVEIEHKTSRSQTTPSTASLPGGYTAALQKTSAHSEAAGFTQPLNKTS